MKIKTLQKEVALVCIATIFLQCLALPDSFASGKSGRKSKKKKVETVVRTYQNIQVTGRVIADDEPDGMPGVNVLIKGTMEGTVTDLEGNFAINVPDEAAILVFSSVGYVSQEVTIGAQTVLNITLASDIQALEEIVVIGYGTTEKKDLTGSVQSVTAKDFNGGAISSPQQLITGKVAGVQITDAGGAPGTGSTIRIRGGSSLTASNDPLIIIDGVPIDNEGVSGARNPLNVINPNDIETFTVLKDASATAIYGSRASNGVIIITTKKGTTDKIALEYTGNFSLASPINKVPVLSTNEYRQVLEEKFPQNTNLMGDASTDWQDNIFRTAFSTDHTVAASGGASSVLPYRASLSYNQNNGILDGTSMERITAALNLNPSFFEDMLTMNISAKYMNIGNNFGNEGALGSATAIDPTQVITGSEFERFGGYYTWTDAAGNPNGIAPKNPRAQIDQYQNKSLVNRFVGNIQLDYKFHFLPSLRANLNVGMDYSKSQDDGGVVTPAEAAWDADAFARGGSVKNYGQLKRNRLLDFYLQYNHNIDNIESRFDIMGGYSWQHFWIEDEEEENFNTPDGDGDFTRTPYKLTRTENYLVSFFGRFNWVTKERYYLTFTLRNDGSSRFAESNRWGLFPSVALAWTISEEDFMENSSSVSNLKFRIGYGVTGQQDVNTNYGYFGTYKRSQPTARQILYNPAYNPIFTLRPEPYDENLKWEETTTYNAALDFGFLNDRLTGSLEYFLRLTDDLLNEVPVPAGANLRNQLVTNVGSMENNGLELTLNGVAIENENLTWNIGFNLTYVKNKITKLTGSDDPNYPGVVFEGISGGTGNLIKIHRVGNPAGSYYVWEQVYDQSGRPIENTYIDQNGDGQINDDDKILDGAAAPIYLMGLNTSLYWKNWEFTASGHGNFGQKLYNNVASDGAFFNKLQTNGQFISNINNDIFRTGFYEPQYFSNYYVQYGNFFRLDNLMVAYNFSNLANDKLRMRLSFTANNLFILTNYKGLDPEVANGVDNNIYPRPRTFVLGINLTF